MNLPNWAITLIQAAIAAVMQWLESQNPTPPQPAPVANASSADEHMMAWLYHGQELVRLQQGQAKP